MKFFVLTHCTSLHNIIRDGVSPAKIVTEYDSEIHDHDIIKNIVNDTLKVCCLSILLYITNSLMKCNYQGL